MERGERSIRGELIRVYLVLLGWLGILVAIGLPAIILVALLWNTLVAPWLGAGISVGPALWRSLAVLGILMAAAGPLLVWVDHAPDERAYGREVVTATVLVAVLAVTVGLVGGGAPRVGPETLLEWVGLFLGTWFWRFRRGRRGPAA